MPITLGIVVLGAYLSLTLPLTLEGGEQRAVNGWQASLPCFSRLRLWLRLSQTCLPGI